ncbi:MAG: NAD(P)-dependent glycerol-3-phosphate dehydrogenase [Leptotrichiaceae bacterium]|nr:NAD(P)-dependent glycerol-3-phosphate dehydrogenase [Leptotrichiaceae bacterium]MBP6280865.1 NAD(P)-dependent glycerol-3-phosphate dehydrogenase [Leptotrichiaceae bacterium]MBP7100238.1 NAD(P)-dependent glycerol-3-phosphate dehydrogenase [Leptotrichiaceae bacterium]MBP7739571.1 NAD(P)-dependent glycerol-3-phosphate dehydrogenase [Leptotrichiaceae bacterium]MBP9629960.1 NAD(P)-dependent glycerol-3-phosphate dehydrogenase [Leptotrichiaceae bacterium]
MKNVLVIGGGSWGTALSRLLIENGHRVYLWEYDSEIRENIKEKGENSLFLPGIKLPKELNLVNEYCEVLENIEIYSKIDVILLATPTQFLRPILKRLKNCLNYNVIIVNVAKGLEISTKKRISEVISEELKDKDYNYVLLAGPTHAEEVAKKLPSAILSVSNDEKYALEVQQLFSNSYFRVYTGTDLVGAELGGAVKNCLAIAAGIADGLGYGDNSKAALLTRGLNEIMEIGKYYNVDSKTFMGLSGLGDIIVTCTSKHSRNRYVGEEIGKGKKIEDIISSMKMVSEGAETIKALYIIIKENNINAPILSSLYEVIYEGKPVIELVSLFMSRDLKSEFI